MITVNPNPDCIAAEIIDRAKALSTTLLSDAMDSQNTMDYRLKPVIPGTKLVGTALTVNLRSGDNLALHKAISYSRGYVLIADHKGNTTNAPWGDLMTRAAIKAGALGLVVNGVIRDVNDLRKLGFPVFSLGIVPAATSKEASGEINVPITCAGVSVKPGDLVMGDDDGVVVVPREHLLEVIAKAENKLRQEEKRIQDIDNGIIEPDWLAKKT